MYKSQVFRGALVLAAISLSLSPLSAGIIRVPVGSFHADAGLITFGVTEFATGTVNPVYTPVKYGGGAGAPTVTFDGFFTGQSLSATPGVDCPGGAATGCVVGTPTGTLSLLASSPDTFITSDGANPSSPVLSGTPTFNGAISILFSTDLAGVGLDGGFFNAIGGTAIRAYRRDGTLLGSVLNAALGIEFLGLVTDDGSNSIAGLQFALVGAEPAGFAIDNLRFGTAAQVDRGAPEPGTILLLMSGIAGVVVLRRKAVRS